MTDSPYEDPAHFIDLLRQKMPEPERPFPRRNDDRLADQWDAHVVETAKLMWALAFDAGAKFVLGRHMEKTFWVVTPEQSAKLLEQIARGGDPAIADAEAGQA